MFRGSAPNTYTCTRRVIRRRASQLQYAGLQVASHIYNDRLLVRCRLILGWVLGLKGLARGGGRGLGDGRQEWGVLDVGRMCLCRIGLRRLLLTLTMRSECTRTVWKAWRRPRAPSYPPVGDCFEHKRYSRMPSSCATLGRSINRSCR